MKTKASFPPCDVQTSRLWSIANSICQDSVLPDHLSIDPRSPYFHKNVLQFEIGIRFNGVLKTKVEEYGVSENWVRLPAGGRSKDRYGNPVT